MSEVKTVLFGVPICEPCNQILEYEERIREGTVTGVVEMVTTCPNFVPMPTIGDYK